MVPYSCPLLYTLPSSPLLTGGQVGQAAATSFFSGLLFFSAMAHSPFCTALNSMGFRSPYSPEATSMTGEQKGSAQLSSTLGSQGQASPSLDMWGKQVIVRSLTPRGLTA